MDAVRRIFLVGYRGSGKTSVARLLAGRLGWNWLDADDLLERRLGRTVRQIFAEEGEAGFRAHEAALLAELAELDQHVVATGGGVVLRPENRVRLRGGRVVWLTADGATGARRPNLTVGGRVEVEELLRVRVPLYQECAGLTIDTVGRTPEEVAAAILDGLSLGAAVSQC
jgi:shikimate kinase